MSTFPTEYPTEVQEAYAQLAEELGPDAKIVVAVDEGHWVIAGCTPDSPHVYVAVVDQVHEPDRVDFLVDL